MCSWQSRKDCRNFITAALLHVTGSIKINNDIRQIWDYFNGGIACLPDTVDQRQLKNWCKGIGPWGHQDTQQRKEATYLPY